MPAKTGCVCASTKPGITTRRPASITSQSASIRLSISRRRPTASMYSPRTSIAPSSTIASWRRSPPVRARLAPASVTSCEQLITARFPATGRNQPSAFRVQRGAHQRCQNVFDQSPRERDDHELCRHHSQTKTDHVLIEVNTEPGKQRSNDRSLRPRTKSRANCSVTENHHDAENKRDAHSNRDEVAARLRESAARKERLHFIVQNHAVQHPLADIQNHAGHETADDRASKVNLAHCLSPFRGFFLEKAANHYHRIRANASTIAPASYQLHRWPRQWRWQRL